jgi:hypothetical protein
MVTENELKKLKLESEQAFGKYQKARQEYQHWTEHDSREKWNRLVAAQKEDHEAFQKYVNAHSGRVNPA